MDIECDPVRYGINVVSNKEQPTTLLKSVACVPSVIETWNGVALVQPADLSEGDQDDDSKYQHIGPKVLMAIIFLWTHEISIPSFGVQISFGKEYYINYCYKVAKGYL
jgi:hypothetical protein